MPGTPASAGSLIGKRLGKYEIVALLALGGTAEIYLARIAGASGFEKYVVVKCLHDHLADDNEFVKMFLDEARLVGVLDHSNVVQTFELGEHDGRYYMVMEFLAGLSLAMVMRRSASRVPGGRVPVALILNIASQAAAGLHYAHERTSGGKLLNIVHRDISPQNLVISFEGVVKIVDFGIARAELRETKTKVGTIKGKFAYMSPEQCVAKHIDRRTDVFALGVIVHELLTGRRLFKRESPYETYQAVLECSVPAPSTVNGEIDAALDAIVLKAVAKDREQRFETIEAFGDAMQDYLHRHGKASGPSEVAKFFGAYFGQEIGEHRTRMSELMAGHFDSIDTGVGWDDPAVHGDHGHEVVDLSSHDISVVALDVAGHDGETDPETHINGPVPDPFSDPLPEKTRIELNPLNAPAESSAPLTRSLRAGRDRSDSEPQLPAPPVIANGSAGNPSTPTMIVPESRGAQPTLLGMMPVSAFMNKESPAVPRIAPDSATHDTVLPVEAPPPPGVDLSVRQYGLPIPSTPANDPKVPDIDPPHSRNGSAAHQTTAGAIEPHAPADFADAAPRQALTQWQLGALFVGALGVALLVTIFVAKLLHR